MNSVLPTEQKDRFVIVDIVRGFALIGVLIANFTSYIDQQTPQPVLDSISSPLDNALMNINAVFLEWKFMTLFSILFGYGFGLILESISRKNIYPVPFFLRRMFWLFVFGIIHSLFWINDVLHLYAMSGVFLLLFRNRSNKVILISSFTLMFLVTTAFTFMMRNTPDYFADADLLLYFDHLKSGNLFEVFSNNIHAYYKMFILSGGDIHDTAETLGRFLLGYFLLRIGLFRNVETKRNLFKKIMLVTAPVMIAYFVIRWFLLKEKIHAEEYLIAPLISLGILCTTAFYVSLLVLIYIRAGMNGFFRALQSLGKMTLTNYLLVSAFCIILLYGIGFGQLGSIPMHTMWVLAACWLAVEILFSNWWLKRFRYGPAEWIWRQLTYQRRLPLRK